MPGVWSESDAAQWLRVPRAEDDKYRRGVLGIRTGSAAYPGAAVLGVEAAWRTGLGMVRYVGPSAAAGLVLQRRPETVLGAGRVQAWVIGSGVDAASRDAAEARALAEILAGPVPVVADAGALDLVPSASAPVIVTPHAREFARVRSALGLADAADRVTAAREVAAGLGAAVLLKGARTIVAAPDGWTTAVETGTPWLATAGTGDVLAGTIGALVAAWSVDHPVGPDALARLAATGALLHGHAARIAVSRAGGPITALDVADALPAAVGGILPAP